MTVVAGGQGVPDDHSGALQLCQLRLDPGLDLLEPPPFRGARRTADVVGGQRIDDLRDGQAELLELAREPDPVHVALLEGPVATRGTRGRVEHRSTLVEADRVHRNPDQAANSPICIRPLTILALPTQCPVPC